MAHGYTMITGKPQAVMLHTNVGTANAINALIDASRDRVPVLLTSGRTPFTERGPSGARNVYIHWAQEMYDQAGMLREMVKWDYEMKRGDQVADVVDRALELATASPQGPVYLSLPREVLGETVGEPSDAKRPPRALPRAPHPAAADIDRLADWIAAARMPLVITGTLGRDPQESVLLSRIADRFAMPVIPYNTRYFALSSAIRCSRARCRGHCSMKPTSSSCSKPTCPGCQQGSAGAGCEDRPDRRRSAVRALSDAQLPFRSDPDRQCTCGARGAGAGLADRCHVLRWPNAMHILRSARTACGVPGAPTRKRPARGDAINMAWLNHCLREVVDRDTIVINEYSFRQEYCPLETPGSLFGVSAAGGLGWGFPAALGAKLASPDKTVVAVLGDGAYMFANPTACHHVSQTQSLPTLTVSITTRCMARCGGQRWTCTRMAPRRRATGVCSPNCRRLISSAPSRPTAAMANASSVRRICQPRCGARPRRCVAASRRWST